MIVSISSLENERGLIDEVRERAPAGSSLRVVSAMVIIWFIVAVFDIICIVHMLADVTCEGVSDQFELHQLDVSACCIYDLALTDCVSTVSMHSINAVLHRFAVDLGPLLLDATGAAGASLAALTAPEHKSLACNTTEDRYLMALSVRGILPDHPLL